MTDFTPTEPRRSVTPAAPAQHRISAFGATHPGLVRGSNDDAFRIEPSIGLVVVADGVATTLGGGSAARIVVDTVSEMMLAGRAPGPSSGDDALAASVLALRAGLTEAHRCVCEESRQRDQPTMATTVAALFLTDTHAILMHIGDSRVYRLRAGVLEQLTEDHSMAAEYRRRHGSIAPELARLFGNVITRAVSPRHPGASPAVRVELLIPGDVFVVCTDGLTGGVPDATIAAVVGAAEPRDAVAMLLDLANDAGGGDNITVAVVRPGSGDISSAGGPRCA